MSSSYNHHPRHSSPSNNSFTRSTLIWGELEPWMDDEYAKQVCKLMGWDPISIKIPQPAPSETSPGQLANNPGYCFLTFPSQANAASVLAGLSGTMPNSTKPFSMTWASSRRRASRRRLRYPKEYSIFVGDLAPETSNSDLVAVFRNPVLGLRNDREPKFIRPFLSCKSAKIMLDPITGVSRGYGFVRFTDESDQQRALIEMHGLYCLSRPMRISPATAKFKTAPPMTPQDIAQLQQYGLSPTDQAAIAASLPQTKSVSASVAQPTTPTNAGSSTTSSSSASSLATTGSSSSFSAVSTDTGSNASLATTAVASEHLPKLYDSNATKLVASNSITTPFAQEPPRLPMDYNPAMGTSGVGRYLISEESWKHHTQARAILGNLIGPNGEQLTSTDPYNTTVFVGGLSPLIQEETLRTFFAPFGDIHYVKVPIGKHCGFVQFVRKADAERAIEKMQGFPIGGSRIRLSWGRSQYKAAQAAAQAAQAAAMSSQSQHQNLYNLAMQMPSSSLPMDNASLSNGGQLTQEQAIQLLQKLSQQGYMDPPFPLGSGSPSGSNHSGGGIAYTNAASSVQGNGAHALERLFISPSPTTGLYSEEKLRSAHLSDREDLVAPTYDGRFDLHNFAAQQQQQHHVQPVHHPSSHPSSHPHQPSQHLQPSYSKSSVAARSAVSFSPFSPDPNALYTSHPNSAAEQKSRESYGLGAVPNFEESTDNGSGDGSANKFAPTRPISISRYANYQGLAPRLGSGSTGTSPVNRTSMPVPISRPSSGQPASTPSTAPNDLFDMHDLNGTLASLDLGEASSKGWAGVADNRVWGVKSPAGSSDSGTSVQFQMTREDVAPK
ncbi:hypothetical protein BDP27DRAFT_1296025 [Rhodocollybia butyracea]|uniref:RRM domain-containing protein n=1 Tax=Rhodocollybia butyracea TaxID=206335 RepID=A0A9P5PT84_9AGAR|nr:hypothetical protein BDP27DRAFT_1296025 [Rhodocollybia butyracea]